MAVFVAVPISNTFCELLPTLKAAVLDAAMRVLPPTSKVYVAVGEEFLIPTLVPLSKIRPVAIDVTPENLGT